MKYEEIMKHVKKERIATAITTAARMYLETGIAEARMTDIAEQAQIGVASLYRYFGTKQLFTVKVASYIWRSTLKKLEPIYTGAHYEAMTGLEQARTLMNIFLVFMDEHRPFLLFLSEFDMYVIREHLEQEQLKEFESCTLNIHPVMTRAIEKGKSDGTIRPDMDPDLYYHTVADTLVSLCQRCAWGTVPHSEDAARNRRELEMVIDMFLGHIRAN